ncbi:hypothetical protein ABK040_011885 [Willaertia magna]
MVRLRDDEEEPFHSPSSKNRRDKHINFMKEVNDDRVIQTKNELIEYQISNIHKKVDEETIKKNQRNLNEILTRTLYQAKKSLGDLYSLTKRKLGPKAVLYQHNTNNDDIDPFTAFDDLDGEEGKNDDILEQSVGEDLSSLTLGEERTPLVKKNVNKLGPLDDNLILDQLVQLLLKKKREESQIGVIESSMRDIFQRTRGLIEEIWEEMNIEEKDRVEFSKKYFYPETLSNHIQIFKEISKLINIRSIQHRVLTNIEQREVYIGRLREIALKVAENKTVNPKNPYIKLYDPLVKNEVPTIVNNLRDVTIDLVESILIWRNQLIKKNVFIHNGENYMLKMRNDLDFLKLTELAPLFEGVGIVLDSNPLLLPDGVRCTNELTFHEYIVDMMQRTDSQLSGALRYNVPKKSATRDSPANNSSNSMLQLYAPKASKTENTVKTEEELELLIPKIIKVNLPYTYMEGVRATEKIIFQEDLFIKYLENKTIRDRAATKIQSQWRSYNAKKYFARIRQETRKVNVSHNSSSHSLKPSKIDEETMKNKAEKFVASLTEKDLKEELDKSRKGDTFSDSWNISGRYAASIFD